MSSYVSGAGLTALVGGASVYLWKSGVIQRYLGRQADPVADQFVKSAVKKHLTDDEQQAILKKLSQSRFNLTEEAYNLAALKSLEISKFGFYPVERINVKIENLRGKTHIALDDGQCVPIEKALDYLERKSKPDVIDPASLDEDSKKLMAHYDEKLRQYMLENTRKSFDDCQQVQDFKSGKLSLGGITERLDDLKLEQAFRTGKAFRTIKKYSDQKGDYRRLLEKGGRTPDEQWRIDQFEARAAYLEQSIRANKKAPVHNLSHDEKLLSGFLNSSTHNFYTDIEQTRFDPAHDPVLQANIDAFKAKIAADPLLSNPVLQDNPLRAKLICYKLLDHVNDSFPVDTREAEAILDQLGHYNTRNLLGDYIEQGIGVCRHKALLTKAIADQVGLKVSLNSGMYSTVGPHAWNTVKIGDKLHVLDAHNNRFTPWSDTVEAIYRQGKTRDDVLV